MAFTLEAQSREITGKKTRNLRKEGIIPAVVYGPDLEPVNIQLVRSQIKRLYEDTGNSSVITLNVDEGKAEYDVLIHDMDKDPITEFLVHVDFYAFKKGQKLNTSIHLNFIGEPATIKLHSAILVKQIEELNVSCLPKDLVSSIDVDLTTIKELDDVIKVGDLNLPEGIEPENDVNDIVAGTSVVMEEAEVDPEEVSETEMPEVEKKGKKEDEDAEGEEAKPNA